MFKPMHLEGTRTVKLTFRDCLVISKALGYAIVTIERLPFEWQENSDKEDMEGLLRIFGIRGLEDEIGRENAIRHIEGAIVDQRTERT